MGTYMTDHGGFLTRIRRPRAGKRGISAGQRRESAERRVPLGGSLFRRAALEVPDDSLQAWPAASISAFNGHGFLVRKPQCGLVIFLVGGPHFHYSRGRVKFAVIGCE